jgi:hypothetical protein
MISFLSTDPVACGHSICLDCMSFHDSTYVDERKQSRNQFYDMFIKMVRLVMRKFYDDEYVIVMDALLSALKENSFKHINDYSVTEPNIFHPDNLKLSVVECRKIFEKLKSEQLVHGATGHTNGEKRKAKNGRVYTEPRGTKEADDKMLWGIKPKDFMLVVRWRLENIRKSLNNIINFDSQFMEYECRKVRVVSADIKDGASLNGVYVCVKFSKGTRRAVFCKDLETNPLKGMPSLTTPPGSAVRLWLSFRNRESGEPSLANQSNTSNSSNPNSTSASLPVIPGEGAWVLSRGESEEGGTLLAIGTPKAMTQGPAQPMATDNEGVGLPTDKCDWKVLHLAQADRNGNKIERFLAQEMMRVEAACELFGVKYNDIQLARRGWGRECSKCGGPLRETVKSLKHSDVEGSELLRTKYNEQLGPLQTLLTECWRKLEREEQQEKAAANLKQEEKRAREEQDRRTGTSTDPKPEQKSARRRNAQNSGAVRFREADVRPDSPNGLAAKKPRVAKEPLPWDDDREALLREQEREQAQARLREYELQLRQKNEKDHKEMLRVFRDEFKRRKDTLEKEANPNSTQIY